MKIALLKANAPGVPFIYKLINWCSGFDGFGHAELQFHDGTALSSHTGQGAAIRQPAFQANCWVTFDIHRVHEEGAIKKWGRSEFGPGYDYLGVMRFLPGLRWIIPPHPRNWFCSEIVTAACQRLGMFLDVKPSAVSPNRLYELCVKAGLKPQAATGKVA